MKLILAFFSLTVIVQDLSARIQRKDILKELHPKPIQDNLRIVNPNAKFHLEGNLLSRRTDDVRRACESEVRLDQPGYAMEHMYETWQGTASTCYAHAALRLYDSYRKLTQLKGRSLNKAQ